MSATIARRGFIQSTAALAGLMYFSPQDILRHTRAGNRSQRLSWLAYQGTMLEGLWSPGNLEGTIPPFINGRLLRIGPGSRKNHGVELQHFFDGDAHLTEFQVTAGQIQCRSALIQTPEFKKEKAAGQMLFHEFGTASPKQAQGFKNSPNVNVVEINNQLLALSEGAHPIQVNQNDLSAQGPWNFQGQLTKDTTFTAHPRKDPTTGITYAYGLTMSLSPQLKVFSLHPETEKLTVLAQVDLGGFYLVHDLTMTENYLVFVVPPMAVNLFGAATLAKPLSELLEYDPNGSLRIIVIRKDGLGSPVVIESKPGGTGFHHCNAYENKYGQIILHTILNPDDSVFHALKSWNSPDLPVISSNHIVKMIIDLEDRKVVQRQLVTDGVSLDFPCIDHQRQGSKIRFVHALEAQTPDIDALALNGLVCWDLETQSPRRISAGPGRLFREPLFIPNPQNRHELDGVLALLGYDQSSHQSFLEFRQPLTLDLIARQWLDRYLPLGFHGHFIPA